MQASVIKLEEILWGTLQYIVPLFQRPYSWTKKEWQDLWNDIEGLLGSTENPRPHFLGSIVTMPTTSVPHGVSKYLLIDGQQRLTTIFILLAALRDAAKGDGSLAEEINNSWLVNYFKSGLDYYKVQPTQVDREAFHSIIGSKTGITTGGAAKIDSAKTAAAKADAAKTDNGIAECYGFFEKKIKLSKYIGLDKIKTVIGSSLSIVSVVLSPDDDPHLVFESLNAKGRPLTQADLIRNYFFMRIHTNDQDSVYAQYWKPMQELLGENLTEFIRHYLTRNGVDVKQNEIYFEIKERLSKYDAVSDMVVSDMAVSDMEDLGSFAKYYSRLLKPELETNDNVRKYPGRLKRLDVSTVYPFLLNCYDDWMRHGRINAAEFVEIMQVLENFIIRRFVCDISTRRLNRIFASLYSQVSKGTDLAADGFVDKLKLVLQTRDYPTDAEFQEKLLHVNLYEGNRSEKGWLILQSIEEDFGHKETVSLVDKGTHEPEHEEITIEHVMPQNLTDAWKEHLGADYERTHELLLHTLGNLTLTAYNSQLGNKSFAEKKVKYSESKLDLNKYFVSRESWQKQDIEKRAEALAKIVLKIWPYFGTESAAPSPSIDLTGTRPKLLRFLGKEYPVKSWRDVLEQTFNTIADGLDEEEFREKIITQLPRFVSWESQYFRSTRELNNHAFIKVNLAAKNIYLLCQKLR